MHTVLISLLPAAAVGTEALFCVMTRKPLSITDGSAAVTGMLLALSLSPSTPVVYPILGAVFAILVAKCCFGGLGKNFINPALAGRCFLLMSFGATMTQFPALDGVTSATPFKLLSDAFANGTPLNLDVTSMFLGTSNGVIGSSIIALLIGGLILWGLDIIHGEICFSVLQSPTSVILEPPKIKSLTFFPHLFAMKFTLPVACLILCLELSRNPSRGKQKVFGRVMTIK